MEKAAKHYLERDALLNIRKAVRNAEDPTVRALLEFNDADERKLHEALDTLLKRERDFQT